MSGKEVKRAIVLSGDDMPAGGSRQISGKTKRKKKKQAAALKPLEKNVRSVAKSLDKATKEYFTRHDRSNSKKKNGWIRDYTKNMNKAMSKLSGSSLVALPGLKGVKLPKLF